MRRSPESALLCLATLIPLAAAAQTAPGTGLSLRGDATLIVSDNLGGGTGVEDAGVMLSVTPGLGYRLRTGSSLLDLEYTPTFLQPFRVSTPVNRVQHVLRSTLRSELADSGLSLVARGDVTQQTRSAFGSQQSATGLVLGNQLEVYSAQVEPAWTARLGSLAEARLSHSLQVSNTRRSALGDSTQRRSTLALSDTTPGALGWSFQLQRSETDPKQSRSTFSDVARLSLNWQPDADWRLGLSGGRERSDQLQGDVRSRSIVGASVRWLPGPRTQMGLSGEQRVAGRTHDFDIQHRFVRSAFSYRDSRNISAPGVTGASGSQSNYDLLFAQLASIEPDPVRRDELVRTQLQQRGLDADAIATQGFLSGRSTLTRSRTLGVSYSLVRSTLTATLSRSDSERLGAAGDAQDDFALTRGIATQGASLSLSHQLTPISGVSLQGRYQRNEGDAGGLSASTLKSLSLSWTTRLGQRSSGSLSLRKTSFNSARNPYAENALLASLNHQF